MTAAAKRARRKPTRDVARLEDIINIGPSIAGDLRSIGIAQPRDLIGKDPYAMFDQLCLATGGYQDPCVLDTFIASVRFMEGAPARPWYWYTAERKRTLTRS